jgi:hypothetical protein
MMTPKYGEKGEMTLMKGRLVASGNEVDHRQQFVNDDNDGRSIFS